MFVMPCSVLYDSKFFFNVDVELRVPLDTEVKNQHKALKGCLFAVARPTLFFS